MTLSKGPTTTTPVRQYVQPNKQITLMPKPNQKQVLLSQTKLVHLIKNLSSYLL